eukprot:g8673.t1
MQTAESPRPLEAIRRSSWSMKRSAMNKVHPYDSTRGPQLLARSQSLSHDSAGSEKSLPTSKKGLLRQSMFSRAKARTAAAMGDLMVGTADRHMRERRHLLQTAEARCLARGTLAADPAALRRLKQRRRLQVKLSPEMEAANAEEAELRAWLKFDLFFGLFVIANAVTMGIEANDPHPPHLPSYGFFENRPTTWVFNQIFLIVFMIELALRCHYETARVSFKKGWVQFDATLIFLGVVDAWVVPNLQLEADLPLLSILRVFRLLRLIRLVRLMDQFRELCSLVSTLRGMAFLMMLLAIVIYTSSIFLVQTVGDLRPPHDPGPNINNRATTSSSTCGGLDEFSTIGKSMYALMRIVTLDDWICTIKAVTEPFPAVNGTALLEAALATAGPTASLATLNLTANYNSFEDVEEYEGYPLMLLFFFLFTLMTSFGIMNLLIGRVVQTIYEGSAKQESIAHFEQLRNVTDSLGYVRTWLQRHAGTPPTTKPGGGAAGKRDKGASSDANDAGSYASRGYGSGQITVSPSYATAHKHKVGKSGPGAVRNAEAPAGAAEQNGASGALGAIDLVDARTRARAEGQSAPATSNGGAQTSAGDPLAETGATAAPTTQLAEVRVDMIPGDAQGAAPEDGSTTPRNQLAFVTRKTLGKLYEDPTAKALFDKCGLNYRHLLEVYSEMREARLDGVILADDYFEALIASLEKVSALKMVQITCSVRKMSGSVDTIESQLVLGFDALRKCSYDIWKLMGPFQSMLKAGKGGPVYGTGGDTGAGAQNGGGSGAATARQVAAAATAQQQGEGGGKGRGKAPPDSPDYAAMDLFSPAAPKQILLTPLAGLSSPGDASSMGGGADTPGLMSSVTPREAASGMPYEENTTYDHSASSQQFRDGLSGAPTERRKEAVARKSGAESGERVAAPIVAQTDGEIQRAKREKQAEQDALVWDRFDIFYGFFVVANGIVIGLRADKVAESATTMWTLLDSFFYTVFCVELFQRAVLLNQLENYSDDTLLFGLFPRMDRDQFFKWFPDTLRNSGRFLRDPWVLFDLTILILGALEYVMQWAGYSFDGRMASVFRVFRLLRLIRIIRLFNALRELWLLMEGMTQAIGTLFWATLMIGIMIYVSAIIVKESLVEADGRVKIAREKFDGKWDSLDNACFRMLQVITFDSAEPGSTWFSALTEVADGNLFVFFFMLSFVVLTALGLMNLIVGIMVEQSYLIVQTEKNRLREEAVVSAKQAMLQAKSVFATSALTVSRRQKARSMDELARSIRVSVAQFRDVMRADAGLRAALERGGITGHRIKHIF